MHVIPTSFPGPVVIFEADDLIASFDRQAADDTTEAAHRRRLRFTAIAVFWHPPSRARTRSEEIAQGEGRGSRRTACSRKAGLACVSTASPQVWWRRPGGALFRRSPRLCPCTLFYGATSTVYVCACVSLRRCTHLYRNSYLHTTSLFTSLLGPGC